MIMKLTRGEVWFHDTSVLKVPGPDPCVPYAPRGNFGQRDPNEMDRLHS